MDAYEAYKAKVAAQFAAIEVLKTHTPLRCGACRECDVFNWPCRVYKDALAATGRGWQITTIDTDGGFSQPAE